MPIQDVLDHLQKISSKRRWITCWQHLPPQTARFTEFPAGLSPRLTQTLARLGIPRLYSHQAQVYQEIKSGRHPIIVTPTASGKTLCYNMPVLDGLLKDPTQRALYLFPTKALAYDQLNELQSLQEGLGGGFSVSTYDGDSPAQNRAAIRKHSAIILTNPDMLHVAILPHHPRWSVFFQSLRFIIIDELHQYRGVFGSHLGNVLRRLRRICAFYGSSPQFIMASATLANPKELAEQLTGVPVTAITESGAPAGEKVFIFYNPPLVNPNEWIRRSYLAESVEIAKLFLDDDIQTIIFARSRINVEIMLKELQRLMDPARPDASMELLDDPSDPAAVSETSGRIRGYRGGYLSKERREVEKGLRQGVIRGVVATSALEVGVDIGKLQAAILAGYPGTIASTWQRAGRAGRRDELAVAVLVASSAPLDQFVIRNPEYFFSSSPEHGLVNPDNLLILLDHIRCAVAELPFHDDEHFGNLPVDQFLSFLEEDGDVAHSQQQWHYTGQGYPAEKVSLRTVSPDKFLVLMESGGHRRVIAEIDRASAPRLIHVQAVYLHEGRSYLVTELDYANHTALVTAPELNYFTLPLEQSRVRIIDRFHRSGSYHYANLGEVEVQTHVTGFKKLRFHTLENLGAGSVDLPPDEMITSAFWISFDMAGEMELAGDELKPMISGLLGALTAMLNVAAVMLMADPRDIGSCLCGEDGDWSASTNHLGMVEISVPEDMIPRDARVNLFIYDNYPGGIGLAEQLYKIHDKMLDGARKLISECGCSTGCPSCTGALTSSDFKTKKIAEHLLHSMKT